MESNKSATQEMSLDHNADTTAPSVAELHERLIKYESELVYDPEVSRPQILIVKDDVIALNGISMTLSRSKRFIINTLRLSQGYPQTAKELQDLGFYILSC